MKIRNFIFILMLFLPGLALADITINPNQYGGLTYCSQPVVLAPGFTMDASFSITGMKVSISQGFHSGEDELILSGYSGPVIGYWSDVQGNLTLSGSSDINEYILAMRKVQYRNKSTMPSTGVRTLTFSLDDADYLPDTRHFYRFISYPGIYWTSAKSEAQSPGMKYHGLQGYLATITSEAENAFIKLKTKGVGWIGASDQSSEGDWRWVTGPEGLEEGGQGRLFWSGSGYQAKSNPSVYGSVKGNYHNWNRWDVAYSTTLATTSWEPNNSGGNESYAHITYFPSNPADSYKWNDLPNGGGSGDYIPAGYLIEYGGMPGDPVVNLSADVVLQVNAVSFSSTRNFTKCQGDPVQLNQQENNASYRWNPTNGLSNPLISNPSVTPNVTTIYTVVATNGSCKDSTGFTVNVNPIPVSLLKKTENICVGRSMVLDPGAHASYLWNNGNTARLFPVTAAGKFVVKLTSSNGCTASDSVVVNVQTYPRMDLSGLSKLVCGSTSSILNINKDKGEWLITNLMINQKFITPAIQVASYGTYPFALKLSDSYGCSTDTFLTIDFRATATVNLGNDTTICNPKSINLEAGAGLTSYQWSTGEVNHYIEVKKPGKYTVLVKNSYGCPTKDSINVSFTNRPKLNLSKLDTLTCGSRTVAVNITVDKGIYQLKSPDSSVSINGMAVNVPVYGTFPFSFVSTDLYGCSSDTVFSMGFHKIPKVSFSIDESECYGYNLKATYIGDANIPFSRFSWVFGGDTISSLIGQNIESIPLGDGQTKRDLKLMVNDSGCSDSSSISDIRVIPTLNMTVLKPLQCLPQSFDFKGFNTEIGVTYQWDFGDGTASALKDVIHRYTKDGYYDVSLTVTTNKGCFNTATRKKMVYVAPIPTVGFSISAAKCLNQGKDTLFYVGSAGIKDSYHWNLKGFDPSEIIQSPDTTSGPFIFDLLTQPKTSLSLSVTSQYGCLSDTVALVVKRKPVFSFSSSTKDGCAPFPVNFKAKPDDPVDQQNYKWEFGDGEKGAGADINHSYLISNLEHDVRLSAVSSLTGCMDSLFKPTYIVIHPIPKAGFIMDHDMVFNDMPSVSFTDQSENSVNYDWDFGDGLHSREKDVVHNFDGSGERKILQTVYNQFDCQDTISKKIMIVFNKLYPPNAFSPNSTVVDDRTFKLYSSGIMKEGYHLVIISRWNDIVFECRNEIKGWDGRLTNGNYAPSGNYIWILECIDMIGRPHRQSGSLALVF